MMNREETDQKTITSHCPKRRAQPDAYGSSCFEGTFYSPTSLDELAPTKTCKFGTPQNSGLSWYFSPRIVIRVLGWAVRRVLGPVLSPSRIDRSRCETVSPM